MNNKIVKGIYIQTVENKKVVQKYVPTEDLKLANGETLGEFLNNKNTQIKNLDFEVNRLNQKLEKLEEVFTATIRGFITK